MEGISSAPEEVCGDGGAASTPTTPVLHTRKAQHQKRKRRSSGGPWEGRHVGRGIRRTPHKKAQVPVSSTRTANNIMKFRLGGSVSDPLNLAGGDDVADNCSTCAPSPATPLHGDLEPFDLPPQLMKDPLNLEGKVKNFPVSGKCVYNMMCWCGCGSVLMKGCIGIGVGCVGEGGVYWDRSGVCWDRSGVCWKRRCVLKKGCIGTGVGMLEKEDVLG